MRKLQLLAGAFCSLLMFSSTSYASVNNDQVTSQKIKEADGTSGQNTNSGSGVKTGHIQNGAVTNAKLGSDVESRIAALETQVAALQSLLVHFSRHGNEVTISGANLYLVNGTGATNGALNGLGNLVVGYNELRQGGSNDRTGSHNLIVGAQNNYCSYGGIVGGQNNEVAGSYATVAGGRWNTASGDWSFVGGGGDTSAVGGNTAFGKLSSILGGSVNIAGDPNKSDHTIGQQATVSGGYRGVANGWAASISGGNAGRASGSISSVGGGTENQATESYSSVSGGQSNLASGGAAWVGGGFQNSASGVLSSVSGGNANAASGWLSSVSGGYSRSASGPYNWAAGSLSEAQ